MSARIPAALVLVFLLTAASARTETLVGTDLPAHTVADPSAPPVSSENLLASERFWPYRITAVKTWQPKGAAKPLEAGSVGVLVRVEADGTVRADFGRDGLYEIPLDVTDLLDVANQVRTGKIEKTGPNFAVAILPRLADPRGAKVEPWSVVASIGARSYLAVFADPKDPAFAEIARALAPLRAREGVLAVLFPQGRADDEAVRLRLREVGWREPFVVWHLAAPYTKTLIDDTQPRPHVALYSPEGRTLFESGWSADTVASLTAALDAAVPAGPTIAGSQAEPAPPQESGEAKQPAEIATP